MRFLFVTYRWGNDLLGGAEIHHRRLAQELVDLGHQVHVLTTTGHGVRPFAHWGVEWTPAPPDVDENSPIPVTRVPNRPLPRWIMAGQAKLLQWFAEREEASLKDDFLLQLARSWPARHGIHLMNGWHYPEYHEQGAVRWTQTRARFFVRSATPNPVHIIVKGTVPRDQVLTLSFGGRVVASQRAETGWFSLTAELPAKTEGIVDLRSSRPWRPLREFRCLGAQVHAVELHSAGEPWVGTNMAEDYRALGRAVPEVWQATLLARARARPPIAGRLLSSLRGPRAPALRAALNRLAPAFDHVIHCNLPWGNMDIVRQEDLAMALWHIEDEFYTWQHWIEALRRTRLVLANTPHTAKRFFPGLDMRAAFVGPPVWEPTDFPSGESVAGFRARHGILPKECLILTVSRKSGEKRYDTIADSVARMRTAGHQVRMLGIGPDADGRVLHHDGCLWLGKLEGDDLQLAYAACDVFCLMSESESFGMVVPEAWHHGKPVVVSRRCPTTASLLDEGKDGLLAVPGAELDDALTQLANDPSLRTTMGEAGRCKAEELYHRGAAASRLLAALGRT